MKELIDIITERRSTRKFTDQPIEQEKLDLILKAALMAPSSKRCTPWHFVVVEDANDLQAISESRQMGRYDHFLFLRENIVLCESQKLSSYKLFMIANLTICFLF